MLILLNTALLQQRLIDLGVVGDQLPTAIAAIRDVSFDTDAHDVTEEIASGFRFMLHGEEDQLANAMRMAVPRADEPERIRVWLADLEQRVRTIEALMELVRRIDGA